MNGERYLGLVLYSNFGSDSLLGVTHPCTSRGATEEALTSYLKRPGVPESAYGLVVPVVALVLPEPRPCPTCGQAKAEERPQPREGYARFDVPG